MADEEPVREVGPWSIRKLEYLSNYLEAFGDATGKVLEGLGSVVYVDLFAGPGRLRDRTSGEIHLGSPAIAMALYPKINRFILVDREPSNIRSLQAIAHAQGLASACTILERDSNAAIDEIVSYIPTARSAVLAFVDPESPNLDWSTVRTIAVRKSSSRYKIEQFILFPYDMGIARMLPQERHFSEIWPGVAEQLDDVMPDRWRWRAVYEAVRGGEFQRERELRRRFLYLYWRGLRDLGYRFVPAPKLVKRDSGQPLYFMFFATDHAVGDRIMRHVLFRQRRLGEPIPLPLDDDPYEFSDHEDWYENLQPVSRP